MADIPCIQRLLQVATLLVVEEWRRCIWDTTPVSPTVAIKVLRTDHATDPTFIARFRQKRSPPPPQSSSIVAVYDTGEESRRRAAAT